MLFAYLTPFHTTVPSTPHQAHVFVHAGACVHVSASLFFSLSCSVWKWSRFWVCRFFSLPLPPPFCLNLEETYFLVVLDRLNCDGAATGKIQLKLVAPPLPFPPPLFLHAVEGCRYDSSGSWDSLCINTGMTLTACLNSDLRGSQRGKLVVLCSFPFSWPMQACSQGD